jgi:hypothetical protein
LQRDVLGRAEKCVRGATRGRPDCGGHERNQESTRRECGNGSRRLARQHNEQEREEQRRWRNSERRGGATRGRRDCGAQGTRRAREARAGTGAGQTTLLSQARGKRGDLGRLGLSLFLSWSPQCFLPRSSSLPSRAFSNLSAPFVAPPPPPPPPRHRHTYKHPALGDRGTSSGDTLDAN